MVEFFLEDKMRTRAALIFKISAVCFVVKISTCDMLAQNNVFPQLL
jgi:hypothetical protein